MLTCSVAQGGRAQAGSQGRRHPRDCQTDVSKGLSPILLFHTYVPTCDIILRADGHRQALTKDIHAQCKADGGPASRLNSKHFGRGLTKQQNPVRATVSAALDIVLSTFSIDRIVPLGSQ